MPQTEIRQFRKIKNLKTGTELKEQDMNYLNAAATLEIDTTKTGIRIKKLSELLPSETKVESLVENNTIIHISSDDEIKEKIKNNTGRAKRRNVGTLKSTIKKTKQPLQTVCIDSDDDFQLSEIKPANKTKLNLSLTGGKSQKSCYNNSDSDFEYEKKTLSKTSTKKLTLKGSLRKSVRETPKTSRISIKSETQSKTKRKLTNSTNLKNFSAKNQPNSQKYMKQYFTLMPKTTIGYFDTFKESFQSSKIIDRTRNIKVENFLEHNSFPDVLSPITSSEFIDNKLFEIKASSPEDSSITKGLSTVGCKLPRTSKRIARKKLQFSNDLNQNSIKNIDTKCDTKKLNDSISDCILIGSESDDLCDLKLDLSENGSKNLRRKLKKENIPSSIIKTKTGTKKQRKRVQCPEYKIVENTTFAVDAFRFGEIEGVTHYFLTHFHGDHYIGLTKKFAKPIYMSEITARLVDSFIKVDKQYIHIIQLNQSLFIENNDLIIEVTAIDANHCPGAIMFAFKFPDSKCYLHTGDFRASMFMESEPYFWNNTIDLIYLDTTYLNKNYAFKDQSDSLHDLEEIIENFQKKNIGKKILYVCGSYVIGKEKVWCKLHELTGGLIYVDKNRKKALEAIGDKNILYYLVDNPHIANIHVLPMNEISYLKLWDYLKEFDDDCDLILAIRASGWERNSKPQYRGKINIVGIEYSEHSSYTELRRFVRFLQPKKLISTVPNGSDLSKTGTIPISWYNNSVKPKQQGFQKSITNYVVTKKSVNQVHNQSPNIVLDATLSTAANLSNSETDWMS